MSYLYSFVVYLYVNGDGSIASVGEEGAVCLLLFACGYVVSVERFPLPLGTLDGLRCFVIALPQPSMWLFFKIYDYCDVLRTFYKESKNISFNRSEYVIFSLISAL